MISEVPILKFHGWHMAQAHAFKHNSIWEERGLERTLGLVQVLGHFGLPFLWGDVGK